MNYLFGRKFIHELLDYFALTIYIAMFFCTLSYLKFAILEQYSIAYALLGVGLIKALIYAKFMLIVKSIYPIKAKKNQRLIWHILGRSIIYLIAIMLLGILEIITVAKFHGDRLHDIVISLTIGQFNQFVAVSIIYWLMLIPYITYIALNQVLGDGVLYGVIFRKEN